MKKFLCFVLTLCTAAALASCGKAKKSGSEASSEENTSASESVSGSSDPAEEVTDFTNDGYIEKIMEKIKDQERSEEPFDFKEPGELIQPGEDDDDAVLGSYHVSSDGVKLYYEEGEYPLDMLLTLEKYFTAYADGDYTQYTRCVYPGYIDKMEAFLQKEYKYGMKRSFANQCSNLASNMGGDFKITRIKLEKPENSDDASIKKFFDYISDMCGNDFYSETAGKCDKFHFATFYAIAEDAKGNELSLITGFDIVFAEKDGRFYAFG